MTELVQGCGCCLCGAFVLIGFKGVRISRPAWLVALYAGDSWYWPGYTGVVRVAVR